MVNISPATPRAPGYCTYFRGAERCHIFFYVTVESQQMRTEVELWRYRTNDGADR